MKLAWYERSSQLEQDDHAMIKYLISINPPDFVNYALPRTKEIKEIITDKMRFDRLRAREYFDSTMGSSKRHLYDHLVFLKIYKGIK
jgi:hypothetical protein